MVPLHLCAQGGEPPLPGADEIEPQLSSVYLQGETVRGFVERVRSERDTSILAVCETGSEPVS